MAHRVIVRFAGVVDPAVRREAVKIGLRLPPGKQRRIIFRGYLVEIVGHAREAKARALELGVEAVALFGVAGLSEQNNSYQQEWRLPLRSRLQFGGQRIPVSVPPEQLPIPPGGATGLPRWRRSMNLAYYRHFVESESRNGGDPATLPTISFHSQVKAEVQRRGVVHASCQTMSAFGQLQDPFTMPWLDTTQFISSGLQIDYWSQLKGWSLFVTDDWLSSKLGHSCVFSAGAYREGEMRNSSAQRSWYVAGPTRAPRLFPGEDDALIGGTNNKPHTVTRESLTAYRQTCYPSVKLVGDRVVIGATYYRLDDEMFEMFGTIGEGEELSTGYVSTRSMLFNTAEIGAAVLPAAGEPRLAVMWLDPLPVTQQESNDYDRFNVRAGPDVRYVMRQAGMRSPAANPPDVGSDALAWTGVLSVGIGDLPAWWRPGTVAARCEQLYEAFEADSYPGPASFVPNITSGHVLPAAFGAVYSTEIDGDIEFAFAVRSLAPVTVPVNASRRATADTYYPASAALLVAKTGIVFAAISALDPGAPTVRCEYPDLVGPADCDLFGDGMDADVAMVPQVRYACVLGGKRVYVARVARFERNAYLASALSMIGVGAPQSYTPDYAGRMNESIGGPVFFTDREFGPYPDREQLEELWFIVDGVRHRVNPNDLGGRVEPVTEAKYIHSMRNVFEHASADAWLPHRRQQLGMFSEEDEADYELLDAFADEFAPQAIELNTFDQISDTDLVFLLFKKRKRDTNVADEFVVCRFASITGAVTVLFSGQFGTSTSHTYAAISCYQREILRDGVVVQDACLLIRTGEGEAGSVFSSVDGGVTWELLYDEQSTVGLGLGGAVVQRQGTPGLGLHLLGLVGDVSAQHGHIIMPPRQEQP